MRVRVFTFAINLVTILQQQATSSPGVGYNPEMRAKSAQDAVAGYDLGVTSLKKGKHKDAAKAFLFSLENAHSVLGFAHVESIGLMTRVADSLNRAGLVEDSLFWLSRALDVLENETEEGTEFQGRRQMKSNRISLLQDRANRLAKSNKDLAGLSMAEAWAEQKEQGPRTRNWPMLSWDPSLAEVLRITEESHRLGTEKMSGARTIIKKDEKKHEKLMTFQKEFDKLEASKGVDIQAQLDITFAPEDEGRSSHRDL